MKGFGTMAKKPEDELDDDLDLDGEDDELDSGSDNSAPPDENESPTGEDKRVNDLMGKWQKEQAENAKLRAEIDAFKAPDKPAKRDAPQGNVADDGSAEFVQFTRETARNALFGSVPKLAQYGLKSDDIAGSTLDEMKASLKASMKLVEGIETRARNQVLAEHGLDPEVSTGASSEKTPDFSKMSDKEFDEWEASHGAPRGRGL